MLDAIDEFELTLYNKKEEFELIILEISDSNTWRILFRCVIAT